MTIVTADTATWTWSPEVLELARRQKVEDYLDPLMKATRELFPAAREIRVYLATDPEIAGLETVAFEVHLPRERMSGNAVLSAQG